MDAPINAQEPPKGVSPTIWKKALDAALSLLSKGRNYAMQKGEFTPEHRRAYGFNSEGFALNRMGHTINPYDTQRDFKTAPPYSPREYTQFDPITMRPLVNPVTPPPNPMLKHRPSYGGKKSRHTKKRSTRK